MAILNHEKGQALTLGREDLPRLGDINPHVNERVSDNMSIKVPGSSVILVHKEHAFGPHGTEQKGFQGRH